MKSDIRLLITDDHLIVREGLRLIMETAEGIEVVGEAEEGGQALELADSLKPDVVLMDLRMPGMDGITAITRLKGKSPEIAIIILTTYNEDDLMIQGLKAGAIGFLLKDTDRTTLINTIRAAARGESLLAPDIMAKLLMQTENRTGSASENTATIITEREKQVLRHAANGDPSKEIAWNLGITERTVKAHLTSIYNKLGVSSRAAAVAEAAKKGLLE